MRTALKLSIAALAATALLPVAPAAAAAETDPLCRVELVIYEYPSAGWIYVETGDYAVYQDCLEKDLAG